MIYSLEDLRSKFGGIWVRHYDFFNCIKNTDDYYGYIDNIIVAYHVYSGIFFTYNLYSQVSEEEAARVVKIYMRFKNFK